MTAPGTNENIDTDSKPEEKSNTKFDILRNIIAGLFGACTVSVLFFVVDEVPTLDYITFLFCMVFLISAVVYVYDSPVDNDQDQDGDE